MWRQMMALYESEDSESINETLVSQGVARLASNADKLVTSEVGGLGYAVRKLISTYQMVLVVVLEPSVFLFMTWECPLHTWNCRNPSHSFFTFLKRVISRVAKTPSLIVVFFLSRQLALEMVARLKEAQEIAHKSRAALWRYGDCQSDDEDDFWKGT